MALIEGQIAGLLPPGALAEAKQLFGKRQKARRFAQMLDRTFRLRSELRSLPLPETIVCRCEDVSYSRLREHSVWRAAKLHTRCGMGACQGRVCGPATQFLFNGIRTRFGRPFSRSRRKSWRRHGRPKLELCETNRRTLMNWKGVMPAITTSFTEDLRVDHGFMAKHCRWLLENGCAGVVALGSLGEGATLSFDEKVEILRTCVSAVHGRGPVVASISALTTSEAVAVAKAAADLGLRCSDGAAALCLSGQLAGNENPRRSRF